MGPRFFEFVDKKFYERLTDRKGRRAFQKALQYVESVPVIQTKEEEYEHFLVFYRILSQELPALGITEQQIGELAGDMVYNPEKYNFYNDVKQTIMTLHPKYKLGIVSDAWPSLKDVYTHAGLEQYFDTIVISSQAGSCKPQPEMYQTALDALGIQAQEAVYVDDNIRNCKGAARLHIKAYWLCRIGDPTWRRKLYARLHGCELISDLPELCEKLSVLEKQQEGKSNDK